MSRRPSFSREARQELIEAARYYERESAGLGPRFLAAVEEAVRHLLTYPESAQVLHGRFRRWPLREFPYSIVFSLQNDRLRVLAVAHQKRRPFYWTGRE